MAALFSGIDTGRVNSAFPSGALLPSGAGAFTHENGLLASVVMCFLL